MQGTYASLSSQPTNRAAKIFSCAIDHRAGDRNSFVRSQFNFILTAAGPAVQYCTVHSCIALVCPTRSDTERVISYTNHGQWPEKIIMFCFYLYGERREVTGN